MKKVIELVRKHPILYDFSHEDYKNTRKKDKIWNEIGKKIGENGEAVKKKWRNLRDSYAKYIRGNKNTTGQATSFKKKWIWADEMEAFRPFLSFTKTTSNVSDIHSEESNELVDNTGVLEMCETGLDNLSHHSKPQETETIQLSPIPTPSQSTPTHNTPSLKQENKKRKTSTSVEEIISYFDRKRKKEHDAIDKVFLAHASTVKTFSPRRQIEVKMRIAQVIMEYELQHLEESTSSRSASRISSMNTEDSFLSTQSECSSCFEISPANFTTLNNQHTSEDS